VALADGVTVYKNVLWSQFHQSGQHLTGLWQILQNASKHRDIDTAVPSGSEIIVEAKRRRFELFPTYRSERWLLYDAPIKCKLSGKVRICLEIARTQTPAHVNHS